MGRGVAGDRYPPSRVSKQGMALDPGESPVLEHPLKLQAHDPQVVVVGLAAAQGTAAEYAVGCGRRSTDPRIEETLARCTRALADRGSVVGHVLYGDLSATLERISRYR